MKPILDNQFLEKMRYGDPDALKYWENEVARPSFNQAIIRLGIKEDAQDVSQETQLVMVRLIKQNKVNHILSPRAFASGIARNNEVLPLVQTKIWLN